METDGNFYFLPYSLAGTIDVYGRYKTITPLQFNGTAQDSKEKAFITGLERNPMYDVTAEITYDDFLKGCVLLSDYSKQQPQTIIPRSTLQEDLLNMMAECLPLARTSLIANCGVKGMRCNNDDEARNVEIASQQIYEKAMSGDPFVAVTAQTEIQDLSAGGSALKSEEYLLYMQALDNLRLSFYGLKNGGLFQKKSHMLEDEQEMNAVNCMPAYTDGLDLRQEFCNMVNAIWGLGIWCERNDDLFQQAQVMSDEDNDEETSNDTQEDSKGDDSDGSI
jgi:hypothetical protein